MACLTGFLDRFKHFALDLIGRGVGRKPAMYSREHAVELLTPTVTVGKSRVKQLVYRLANKIGDRDVLFDREQLERGELVDVKVDVCTLAHRILLPTYIVPP
jgi:hypothetical protein